MLSTQVQRPPHPQPTCHAGQASASCRAHASTPHPPQPNPPPLHPCRQPRSLADDPVFSYISTHLASLKRQCSIRRDASLRLAPSHSGPSPNTPSNSSRATSITSGPLAEWELQYEEIRFERPCGAGSYGQVCLLLRGTGQQGNGQAAWT